MTNNLNTIEGAQQEVIDQLEYNLQAKGVLDAQFNPTTGLLGLINRIPDIEPSTNINLDISLDLRSTSTDINYGETIVLTATLLASYDGVSDVDLKTGEITGATIVFKKGNTVIGSTVTDSNGVALLTYTPSELGTLALTATFAGTDNFNSANSTTVNVTVNETLELTCDKNILSYADGDYATLTATLYSTEVSGKLVTFEVRKQSDDTLVETLTDTTDSSGTASVCYYSKGAGDLYIKSICRILIQTYGIEDCYFYRATGSQTHSTGSTGGWYKLLDISNIGDFELTGEISATTNKGFSISLKTDDNNTDDKYARVQVDGGGTTGIYHKNGNIIYAPNFRSYSANDWRSFKFTYVNGVLKITDNYNTDWTPSNPMAPIYVGIQGWNSNKTINYHNLIVKKL